MAMNFGTASSTLQPPRPLVPSKILNYNKQKYRMKPGDASLKVAALSEESTTQTRASDEEIPTFSGPSSSSARMQLDLLDQLTSNGSSIDGYESDGGRLTIRDQLQQLFRGRDDDFSIPLGKNLKKVSAKFLTISQKRNIRRQSYLNEVSQRNDSVFFATIGAFVILPPIIILGVAIATGYVQLFP